MSEQIEIKEDKKPDPNDIIFLQGTIGNVFSNLATYQQKKKTPFLSFPIRSNDNKDLTVKAWQGLALFLRDKINPSDRIMVTVENKTQTDQYGTFYNLRSWSNIQINEILIYEGDKSYKQELEKIEQNTIDKIQKAKEGADELNGLDLQKQIDMMAIICILLNWGTKCPYDFISKNLPNINQDYFMELYIILHRQEELFEQGAQCFTLNKLEYKAESLTALQDKYKQLSQKDFTLLITKDDYLAKFNEHELQKTVVVETEKKTRKPRKKKEESVTSTPAPAPESNTTPKIVEPTEDELIAEAEAFETDQLPEAKEKETERKNYEFPADYEPEKDRRVTVFEGKPGVQNAIVRHSLVDPYEFLESLKDPVLAVSFVKDKYVGKYKPTNIEYAWFAAQCYYKMMNPLFDAFLVKNSDTTPAYLVVSKTFHLKKQRLIDPKAKLRAGIIIIDNTTGEPKEVEGTYYNKRKYTFDGAWAELVDGDGNRKYISLRLDSFKPSYADNQNGKTPWATKPEVMLRKDAIKAVLSEAYPEELGDLYTATELVNAKPELRNLLPKEFEE